LYAVNCSMTEGAELQFHGDFAGFLALDLETGKQTPMATKLHFAPGQSYVLFLTGETVLPEKKSRVITLQGPFRVKECSDNFLTLDQVYYSLDGCTFDGPYSYMGLFQELLRHRFHGDVWIQYRFQVATIPERLYLLAEDMNTSSCCVNGQTVTFDGTSDFEKQLHRADIAPFVTLGENCVEFRIWFYQEQKVYDVLFGNVTESLRNCLVYNTNVEACYLQGDFGVFARDGFRQGAKPGIYLADAFYLGQRRDVVTEPVLEGYPFFAGDMVLETKFAVEKIENMKLELPGGYARCCVKINGTPVKMSYFARSVEIGEYIQLGENVAEITLYSGNRNLLGPHHYAKDENPTYVPPRVFELPKSWVGGKSDKERSSYSFVPFGLFTTQEGSYGSNL